MSDMPPPPLGPDSGWPSQPPAPPGSSPPGPGRSTGHGLVVLGTGDTVALATAGGRLGARIIDGIILVFAGIIVDLIGPVMIGSIIIGPIIVGPIIVGAFYEVMFVSLKGQTPGKMATGIKIVRADNGGRPGWGASTGRWAIPAVGYLLFVLPGLLVNTSLLWGERRRGWHDKAVNTLVVTAQHRSRRPGKVVQVLAIAVAVIAVAIVVLLIVALFGVASFYDNF